MRNRIFTYGLLMALHAVLLPLLLPMGAFAQTIEQTALAQNAPSTQKVQRMKVKRDNFSTFYDYTSRPSAELARVTPADLQQHPEYGLLPWDAPCVDCHEVLEKRTPTGRFFVRNGTSGSSDGEIFYKQEAYGPIHFKDASGRLLTLDPHLRPTSEEGVYYAPSQPLPTSLDLSRQRSGIRLEDGAEVVFNQNVRSRYVHLLGETIPSDADWTTASVGADGMRLRNAWPGIDMEVLYREGSVKTNYRFGALAAVESPSADWFIVAEEVSLPDGYTISYTGDGMMSADGWWTGSVSLVRPDGEPGLEIEPVFVYDWARASANADDASLPMGFYDASEGAPANAAYKFTLHPSGEGFTFETRVSVKWLTASERVFPVTIDPVFYGIDSFTMGDIGFNYDATCFDLTDYCNDFLTVTVPGQTTLTGAWFDAQYFSVLGGCVAGGLDCLMREAAFQIVGPCDTSPGVGTFWTCLPPEGDSAGTCYGDSLDMFNTIACIPPSCPDHVLTFEMRTFMCSCNGPNCGVLCHFMPNNTWKITIEGRTVTENAISSPNFPTFEICEGDSIALTPTGQYGVPGYTYGWSPGGLTGDTILVAPTVTTTYTSVIFDQCGNTDTVEQEVVVNPTPNPLLGPFDGCFNVDLDAGAGWASYFWPHSGEMTQVVNVTAPGPYFVEVTDAFGCMGTSQPIDATINFPPVVTAVPDTLIIDAGSLGSLGATSSLPGVTNYTWAPASTLTCTACPSPLAYPTSDTYYLVYGEQNGCVGPVDSMLVLVNIIDLVLPNAFTPNGDGLNDIFRVTNPVVYPTYEMRIYNRWGTEVFVTDDIRTGWDGTYQGAEAELGVYIWIINYTRGLFDEAEEITLRGDVTLIR